MPHSTKDAQCTDGDDHDRNNVTMLQETAFGRHMMDSPEGPRNDEDDTHGEDAGLMANEGSPRMGVRTTVDADDSEFGFKDASEDAAADTANNERSEEQKRQLQERLRQQQEQLLRRRQQLQQQQQQTQQGGSRQTQQQPNEQQLQQQQQQHQQQQQNHSPRRNHPPDANPEMQPHNDMEPPPIPDSVIHQVKYLGCVSLPADRNNPPNGESCAQAVRYLTRQFSRDKFRAGVAKFLSIQVSYRRNLFLGIPTSRGTDARDFHQRLMQVICVADRGKYVCFASGRYDANRQFYCSAYAFECESEFAARYISEEVVKACQLIFERRRAHIARVNSTRGVQQPEPETPAEPEVPKPQRRTEPNASDLVFYESVKAYEQAIRVSRRMPKMKTAHKRSRQKDRGDGMYYECCLNLGKCLCASSSSSPSSSSGEREEDRSASGKGPKSSMPRHMRVSPASSGVKITVAPAPKSKNTTESVNDNDVENFGFERPAPDM